MNRFVVTQSCALFVCSTLLLCSPVTRGESPRPSEQLQQFLDQRLGTVLMLLGDPGDQPRTKIAKQNMELRQQFNVRLASAPESEKGVFAAAIEVCDGIALAIEEHDKALANLRSSSGGDRVIDAIRLQWQQRSVQLRQDIESRFARLSEAEAKAAVALKAQQSRSEGTEKEHAANEGINKEVGAASQEPSGLHRIGRLLSGFFSSHDSESLPEAPEAEQHWQQGVDLANKGEYQNAIASYDKAIALQPKNPKFRNSRAYAYYMVGQVDSAFNADSKALDNAIADYTELIKLTPHNAEAYFNRGYVYAIKANFQWPRERPALLHRATDDYNQALTIDPQFAKARDNLQNVKKTLADVERQLAEQTRRDKLEALEHATDYLRDPRQVAEHFVQEQIKAGTIKSARFVKRDSQFGKEFAIYYLDYVTEGGFRREGLVVFVLAETELGTYVVEDWHPYVAP